MSKPRIGVVLSGCGVMDGSEIHEAVITLLEIANQDAEAICIAPDISQMHVIDHQKGSPTSETRNVLTESARIARGEARDIREIRADDLDAIIIPGGYGAAKNLCDFATAGAACTVDAGVERLVLDMHAAGKPIGAICIAPAMIARIFGKAGKRVELTIGSDAETAGAIVEMGAEHVQRRVEEAHVDSENKIVSTPAYMLGPGIGEVAKGIAACVREVLRLAG
jgi:enhancing lycopene biosynthesis protein 2